MFMLKKALIVTIFFYGVCKLLLALFAIKHTIIVDFLIIVSLLFLHYVASILLGFLASPKFLLKTYIPSQLEATFGIDPRTIPDKCFEKIIFETLEWAKLIERDRQYRHLTKPDIIVMAADLHIRRVGGSLSVLRDSDNEHNNRQIKDTLRDMYDLDETDIELIHFKKLPK